MARDTRHSISLLPIDRSIEAIYRHPCQTFPNAMLRSGQPWFNLISLNSIHPSIVGRSIHNPSSNNFTDLLAGRKTGYRRFRKPRVSLVELLPHFQPTWSTYICNPDSIKRRKRTTWTTIDQRKRNEIPFES